MNGPVAQTVLLVEDDEMHAELIKRAFEDAPAVILTVARRLDEAVAALRQALPDIVIADLRLPDGRGIDLIEGKACPIVIMTSQGSEADAVEAMRAGALDYVVKSDEMFSDMPHVVDRALREWRLIQAHERADRMLQSQYEIASALATSGTFEEAGPRILRSICESAGWPVGEFWRVDRDETQLRRAAFCALEHELNALGEGLSTLHRGAAVPGMTWERKRAVLLPDLAHVDRAAVREAVVELGLRCAYGCPVVTSDGRTFGVFTFFARSISTPDEGIKRLMGTVSAQLGLFAERQWADEERRRLQQELVASERLAAVGETAATLAHEIANPLNGMYLQGQLMQRRLRKVPDLDPKIMEAMELLLAENVRLTQLLQEFRSLSRGEHIALAPVDVVAVVDRVLALNGPLLEAGGIAIEREIEGEPPAIDGDQGKLTQVFMNLIKNAAEAMPNGGTLTVDVAVADRQIAVEVHDTGVGLPDGVDVFQPFRTTKASGTGLGLSVARQILAAHEGTIGCRARAGGGTTFRVALPLRDPSAR